MEEFIKLWGRISRILGPLGMALAPLFGCVLLAFILKITMGFNFAITFMLLLALMSFLVISGSKKVEEYQKRQDAIERKRAAMIAKKKKAQAEAKAKKLQEEKDAAEKRRQEALQAQAEGKEVSIADLEDDIVPLRQMQNSLDRAKIEKFKEEESGEPAKVDDNQSPLQSNKKPAQKTKKPEQEPAKEEPKTPELSDEELEKIDLSDFDDADFKI